MSDVSDALRKLLETDVTPRMSSRLPIPDHFRYRFAYTEGVDRVLRTHSDSLRTLFRALTGGGMNTKASGGWLQANAWTGFLRACGLVGDGELCEVSDREATLCFLWSRMVTVDDETVTGRLKSAQLPFEGFLEALARVARLTALPTDEDIQAAGCADAGTFMLLLRQDPDEHRVWHATSQFEQWGEEAHDSSQAMPMSKRLEQLLSVIFRAIEFELNSASGDGRLSQAEVSKWTKSRKLGGLHSY